LIELREVEQEIDRLRAEVDMLAYRAAEEALASANAQVAQQQTRREELLSLAAAEAVEVYIREHLIPTYAQAIRTRGVVDLLGRAIESRGYGQNPSPVALRIGRAILDRVAEIISAIRVVGDREAAEQFLVRLGEDPSTEIEPPIGPGEWLLDPVRTPQPLPDGSNHLNTGPVEPPPEPVFETTFGQMPGWAFSPPRGNAGVAG
jgi:hypothetical protein